jgi:hypothetical protein
MDPNIIELKTQYTNCLDWGQQYGTTTSDNKVLQLAWRDAQVVLFMITVDKPEDSIIRPRKRPKNNKPYVKKTWGQDLVKKLSIPTFIDKYNYYMGSINIADQLRSYYRIDRHTFRTWRPLFNFLLQTTIVNAAKLWISIGHDSIKTSGNLYYREKLANQLLSHTRSR